MRRIYLIIIISLSIAKIVLAQDANNYKTIINNGRLTIVNGNYENGIKSLDSAIFLSPNTFVIYKDRGYAEMQMGKFKLAVEDFTRIIRENPNAYDALLQRGIAYYYLNNLDNALNDFRKVLNDNPYHREAKEYLNYVENGKKLVEKNDLTQLKLEQDRIEKIRLEKAKEKENLIKNSNNPLKYWYSVFETW